jgi:hypothetical protein
MFQKMQKAFKKINGKNDEKKINGQIPSDSSSSSQHSPAYSNGNTQLSYIILNRQPN